MSDPIDEHHATSPQTLRCAVVTVSDTGTLETDSGGQSIVDQLEAAGHTVVFRRVVGDEPELVRAAVYELADRGSVDAVLLAGGTGINGRDLGRIRGQTVILSLPGSPAAVRLAMEKLVLPELGQLVREARC